MSRTLQKIVIGTSLTQPSDDAVRLGVALARSTGATPWLIHAYSPLVVASGSGMDALWTAEQVNGLQELISDQARRTGFTDLPNFSAEHVCLELGAPHREVADLAKRIQADLIVVGAAETHGVLGSTADRVIRKAPCPVLAVRSGVAFPPTRIEIPVDFSATSAHALQFGLELLGELGISPAEAEVLFVLNPFEMGGSIHFTPEQIRHFASQELNRFLEAHTLPEARPRLTQVCTGYAREEVLNTLKARQVDLAILGTHGRSGFERLMIGSVAAGVLRSASCNLLIVPPEESGRRNASRSLPADADWRYVSDEMSGASVQQGQI